MNAQHLDPALTQDIVARTMNILEHEYGIDQLIDYGMPTVKEITEQLIKTYAPEGWDDAA